ncbi:aminodeoxychorismate lyase [Agarivorans sp. QJM3NY_33]|uniref:aminodeoxychorismate lyase n=1 Tax=Agarivorans sp. QJM3NY_33 TaxID=3421432 RepID=UPI003D7DC709
MVNVNSHDRGLNYGDGFFTTVLIAQGKPVLWDYHCQRLVAAQQQLGFPQLDLDSLYIELLSRIEHPHAVAKILISRGVGGRGYAIPDKVEPTLLISMSAYPEHYTCWQQDGLSLGVAGQRLAAGCSFSSIKTLNRLEQVMLRKEADQSKFDDLICLDIFDHLIECVSSNLFWLKGNTLYSPDLKTAGVAGIQRRFLMDHCHHSPYKWQVGQFQLDELVAADEIFISNAVLQFAPIKQFNERVFTEHHACRWFQQLVIRFA